MKTLILVLALSSVAQCTLLKTLARSSRGFSGTGSAPYGSSQFSIEKAQEVQESEAFGRSGPGNRYLPPGPPSGSYIPPRSEATHPGPSFAQPPAQNYLPPQPHVAPAPNYLPPQPQPAPAQPSPLYSSPPRPSASYLAPTHDAGAFAAPPAPNYIPPQPAPNYLPSQPAQNYLPPQSAASQGRGVFSPPPQPHNTYVPPPQPSSNYIPPAASNQNFAAAPPAPNYLPPQPHPLPDVPAPSYIPPSPSYIPPANDFPAPSQPQPSGNYLPPQQAGAFDSQSGYSYQAPGSGFFQGSENFEQAGAGFDVRQSDRATSDYLPPQEPHIAEPQIPEQAPIEHSAETGGISEEIGGTVEGAEEHIEEHPAPAPAAPAPENVKTIKVISEPSHQAPESVKTIRVITENRQSSAPVHDDVKVIRVIHENRDRSLDSGKVLRIISDSGSAISSVASSPAQILRIIKDSPAVDTTSKVVRIISDGASSASSVLSSGAASSVLRVLSSGASAPLSAVSELHTNALGESPNKILRIVSDSAGGDLYGSAQVGQSHVKVLKVLSGGSSAISSPSTVLRVLGSAPSAYASNDLYTGYGTGSSALQTFRVLAKRNSVETPVSSSSLPNRYADNSKVLRVVA